MRIVLILLLFCALSIPAFGASPDERIPEEQLIEILEQRANAAQPREQCFLYAELVHEMVEYSAHQYAAGEVQQAKGLLKRTQLFTRKLKTALVGNAKKLKNAQILLRRTAFRLTDLLHSSNFDDRPVVEETLSELNQAQNQAMLEVFRK